MSAVDLDDLDKIRIGHDNSGAGPGWHLDRVVVQNPVNGKSVEFPCGRWLDSKEDDGAIERELGQSGSISSTTKYIVSVTTGQVSYIYTFMMHIHDTHTCVL